MYMIEIEQRRRTANMGLSELAEYLHLPMAEAARRLRLCSTALKHVCRRIGMSRWPSRQVLYTVNIFLSIEFVAPACHGLIVWVDFDAQINAIDRQIARLQKDLVRGTRRGGLLAIKEELERLQERRARLYEGQNPSEGAE